MDQYADDRSDDGKVLGKFDQIAEDAEIPNYHLKILWSVSCQIALYADVRSDDGKLFGKIDQSGEDAEIPNYHLKIVGSASC